MMAITEMIFTDSILQATNSLKSEEMVFGLKVDRIVDEIYQVVWARV